MLHQAPKEIDVAQLKQMRDRNDDFILLDVREPDEYELCHIEGSVHIPLGELADRISELDPDAQYVVHCKMGGRSAKACDYLTEFGFSNVKNLEGGIIQWAIEIDPEMPTY